MGIITIKNKHKMKIRNLIFAGVLLTSCDAPSTGDYKQFTVEITYDNFSKDTMTIVSVCEPSIAMRQGKSLLETCYGNAHASGVRCVKIINVEK